MGCRCALAVKKRRYPLNVRQTQISHHTDHRSHPRIGRTGRLWWRHGHRSARRNRGCGAPGHARVGPADHGRAYRRPASGSRHDQRGKPHFDTRPKGRRRNHGDQCCRPLNRRSGNRIHPCRQAVDGGRPSGVGRSQWREPQVRRQVPRQQLGAYSLLRYAPDIFRRRVCHNRAGL